MMDELPSLKVISNIAVGYDNIDIDAATRRGIMVTNTPGVLTETTAAKNMVEGLKGNRPPNLVNTAVF